MDIVRNFSCLRISINCIVNIDLNSIPKIKDLSNLVTPHYAAKWNNIGLKLGITKAQLDIIEHDHGRSAVKCCNEMWGRWLDLDPNGTWKNVLDSLECKTRPQTEKDISVDSHITKGT